VSEASSSFNEKAGRETNEGQATSKPAGGKAIIPEVKQKRAINEKPRRFCWCPLCERAKQKIAGLCPWCYDGQLVCIYGVCQECMELIPNASEHLKRIIARSIERSLASTYPQIKDRLLEAATVRQHAGKKNPLPNRKARLLPGSPKT